MKMLIASDLHGSQSALDFLRETVLRERPDHVVLLGDLVYHGPRNPLPDQYDTLKILAGMPEFAQAGIPLTAVAGNCDAEVDIRQMPFAMPEAAWLFVDGLQIFATHGHRLPEHAPMEGFKKGTVILRGHTHIPRGETEDGLHFWNPGSLSLPKGGYPPSYGMYEAGVFKVLDKSGKILLSHQPQSE